MISENDSRQTYDLNNTSSVSVQQQSNQPTAQKQGQNQQGQTTQSNTVGQSVNQPTTSITTGQYMNIQNFTNQMDLNQYLENQMQQLTQVVYILKQLQLNHIDPLKNSSHQHQTAIDQIQTHQQQFELFIKQQQQINQQQSLQLQQQQQQLNNLQTLVQQLQAHFQSNHNQAPQAAHQALQNQSQYVPSSQPHSAQIQPQQQVIQIQQPQQNNTQTQQTVQNQQQPIQSIQQPPPPQPSQQQQQLQQQNIQQQTSQQQQQQQQQQPTHFSHEQQLNFHLNQNQLPYMAPSQLISLLTNPVPMNPKQIPIQQLTQLLSNLVYGSIHDDGDNNNLHQIYPNMNLSHLNQQSIEALNHLIHQKLSLGNVSHVNRPIPPTSPTQNQESILNGNMNMNQSEQNLQQIENVLQPIQTRPMSLASSVLVSGANTQTATNSNNNTSVPSNNTSAASVAATQILNHTSTQTRVLNLPEQVVVPDQVLKQNNSGSTLCTSTTNSAQTQQSLISNLQQQAQPQQQNNIPNANSN
ncbi:unnamed protein product [Brachionus calyciflorus]|uniref:Uncharacterized protein n=1 Tax=Brachionus calyciflorus TaxID=104777 RepID=A0A813STR5_9BILA|nr:unnamed protein product [Brachionus calyciflorus]